ncbi:hypothetical protein CBR_g72653 [Chara braunii]|uniref:Uncharacterized protein n=1 Tax=Chara braunii TaxID=69332 RepID=A0A388KA16_CHABU|nr:hypothetical protein CBR_g72653 [Chara braunii]|eukprot:GBG66898.1 hypothetical protein CBR_g72653 [Chara braunii]
MESASMRDFMKELEATLPAMMEGEAILVQEADTEVVQPQPRPINMGETAPETKDECMAREAREDEEEAVRAKALADVYPHTHAMARDMEARRELETVGRVMPTTVGVGVHSIQKDVHGMVAEDAMLEGTSVIVHTHTLESRRFVEEAGGDMSHAVIERERETHGPDIVSAFIAAEAHHGSARRSQRSSSTHAVRFMGPWQPHTSLRCFGGARFHESWCDAVSSQCGTRSWDTVVCACLSGGQATRAWRGGNERRGCISTRAHPRAVEPDEEVDSG